MLVPFSLFLLPLAVSAADQGSRIAKFSELAKKNGGIVPLTTSSYDEILQTPRNYSVSVLLTAMGKQFNCNPCHQFDPEHKLVAKQWQKQPERDEHFFAVLDFVNGQQVFQRWGLSNAPNFHYYKPSDGPRASLGSEKPETMDFSRHGFRAEGLASYMTGSAHIPLKFARPADKGKLISFVTAIVTFLTVCVFAWPVIMAIVSQRHVWAVGVVATILLMTSGHMWNQIRRPPYVQIQQGGRVSYIQGGYSTQVGAETHIVSFIYGVLALSVYTLAQTIPKLRDPMRQRLAIYVWTTISVLMFGLLMNVFSMKQGGYPFKFF